MKEIKLFIEFSVIIWQGRNQAVNHAYMSNSALQNLKNDKGVDVDFTTDSIT